MSSPRVADILRRIVRRRQERLNVESGRGVPAAPSAASASPLTPRTNPFLASLASRRGRAVIAEIKLGSPSLGSLAGRFDPEAQAQIYADHGAAALSVVVEPDFFGGSYELLARCRAASGLPAIAKDFLVDLAQLDHAREARADAVLLVAALYGPDELRAWAGAARDRGLAPLVEIHGEDELALLTGDEWELVGVNNRDLRSFTVDLAHGEAMATRLPTAALKVGESGIRDHGDLVRLREAGYDAFLVGECLVTAADPGAWLAELLS